MVPEPSPEPPDPKDDIKVPTLLVYAIGLDTSFVYGNYVSKTYHLTEKIRRYNNVPPIEE